MSTYSVGEVIQNTNNVIVNDSNKTLNNNVNDNVDKSKAVDLIADKLVLAFNNPNGRPYYCKVAWKLSEHKIWMHLEASAKGRNPAKLFTWLCQRDLGGV